MCCFIVLTIPQNTEKYKREVWEISQRLLSQTDCQGLGVGPATLKLSTQHLRNCKVHSQNQCTKSISANNFLEKYWNVTIACIPLILRSSFSSFLMHNCVKYTLSVSHTPKWFSSRDFYCNQTLSDVLLQDPLWYIIPWLSFRSEVAQNFWIGLLHSSGNFYIKQVTFIPLAPWYSPIGRMWDILFNLKERYVH